jgi:hypothetical protein
MRRDPSQENVAHGPRDLASLGRNSIGGDCGGRLACGPHSQHNLFRWQATKKESRRISPASCGTVVSPSLGRAVRSSDRGSEGISTATTSSCGSTMAGLYRQHAAPTSVVGSTSSITVATAITASTGCSLAVSLACNGRASRETLMPPSSSPPANALALARSMLLPSTPLSGLAWGPRRTPVSSPSTRRAPYPQASGPNRSTNRSWTAVTCPP